MFSLVFEQACGVPLLPMLSIINWNQSDFKSGTEILAFLADSLRCAKLTYMSTKGRIETRPGPEDYIIANNLDALSFRASFLRTLRLDGWIHPSVLDFSGFHNLEKLELRLPFCPPSIIHACACLEHLASLDVSLTMYQQHEDFGTTVSVFPALQHLRIIADQDFALQMLSSISSTSIAHISVDVDILEQGGYQPYLYVRTVETLAARFASSIRFIYLDFATREHAPTQMQAADFIKPLLPLRRLVGLTLEFPEAPTVEDINNMATAWPELRELSLYYVNRRDPLSSLPITVLSMFALHCPSLSNLILEEVHIDQEMLAKTNIITSHKLGWLSIKVTQELTVIDKIALAQFIDNLFPYVEASLGSWYENDMLDEVEKILGALQAARTNERRRTNRVSRTSAAGLSWVV